MALRGTAGFQAGEAKLHDNIEKQGRAILTHKNLLAWRSSGSLRINDIEEFERFGGMVYRKN